MCILGTNCYHDATRVRTLLRATQIDSPTIQKRADISAHERVKPEVAGSVFSSAWHMACLRIEEANIRVLSRAIRRPYEIRLIFVSCNICDNGGFAGERVFANCTVADAIATNEIHPASHSRLLSHRPEVPTIIDTPRNLHPEHVSHLRSVSILDNEILDASRCVPSGLNRKEKGREESIASFFYYVLLASSKVEAAIVQHRHLGTTRPSIDTFRIPSTLHVYFSFAYITVPKLIFSEF